MTRWIGGLVILLALGAAAWLIWGAHDDGVDEARLAAHIAVLASDAFEGRAPATQGEAQTITYIADQFRAMGVQPALGDSYFQAVPMVEITAQEVPPMTLAIAQAEPISLAYGPEVMIWTKRVVERVAVEASDMVFVGYGIVAPDYGWNDYAGIDVHGKTVVILVNDPGFATGDAGLFDGRAMTYYGRWTYKYEEAARQGAAAALIIHQTAPAAYPWGVVKGSWSGPQLDLAHADGNEGRAAVEGWISEDAAHRLFAAAGLDFAALQEAAAARGFAAVPMGAQMSVAFANKIRRSESANVIGIVEGRERPEEAVLYLAHWDHLGRGPADARGDDIYNGAVDNASGVAGLLEIARQFAAKPARRSVVFIATTGEESGLLGSAYYAENPIVPLRQSVAGINMDSLGVIGPVRDVVVIGHGKSELEAILERHAKKQGRTVVSEPTPERGYFYRSDHFNLAKVGVPVLYAEGGLDSIAKGRDWGRAQMDHYTAEHYHQPSDEVDPDWDLRGAVEDLNLLTQVGRELAEGTAWPNWHPQAEFRAARDTLRAATTAP
ncbi:MAG: M28 family metallopeptidase [Pseudomonadota bacterium]